MEMFGMRTSTRAGAAPVLGQMARAARIAREARFLGSERAGGRAPSSAGS